MLRLYRSLLYVYPQDYRCEYGEEMLSVLSQVQRDMRAKTALGQLLWVAHEVAGLISGAIQEHLRAITGSYPSGLFSPRRIRMRSEFRFPKAAVVLMTLILLAILMAIDKARSIEFSGPYPSPQVGPLKPMEFALVPTLLIVLVAACVAGFVGWAIVFALRRSGIHRLSEMNPPASTRR
jgi:hypothetical protein